jgi:hypothetical protein
LNAAWSAVNDDPNSESTGPGPHDSMHQEAFLPPTSVQCRMNKTQMQHTVSMYIRTNQPQRDLTRPALACCSGSPVRGPPPRTPGSGSCPSASGDPRPVRLTSRVCLEQLQQRYGSSRQPTPASSVQRASASCQAPAANEHPSPTIRCGPPLTRRRRGHSQAAVTRRPPSRLSRRLAISGVRRIPGPSEPGHASDQSHY